MPKIPGKRVKRFPTFLRRDRLMPFLPKDPDRQNGERVDRPKQILVDVSILYRDQAHTGIQRVVRALWRELNTQAGPDQVVHPVFATRHHAYAEAPADFLTHPLPEEGAQEPPTAIDVRCGDIFLGLDFAPSLLPRYERQLKAWRQAGLTVHLMVYDLLPLQGPQWFGWQTRRNFRRWLRVLAHQCDQAICISQTVADALTTQLSLMSSRSAPLPSLTTIRLGADIPAQTDASSSNRVRMLVSRPERGDTILMIGTVEPRKAYDVALNAFERLWRYHGASAPTLILVGKPGWKTRALQNRLRHHPEARHRLFWLEDSNDDELRYLYSHCSGLLLPSHAEGYGLPLIEALSCGCPVLARDIPIFREIDPGTGVSYFSDDRPEAMAQSITQWLHAMPEKTAQPGCVPHWKDSGEDLAAILFR